MIAACAAPAPPPAVVEIGRQGAPPPAITSAVTASTEPPQPIAPPIAWESSARDAEARARHARRPLLVWARAEWAVAAVRMERGTWADPRVARAARGFVALRLDLTDADSADAELTAQRFGITTMPMTMVIDAQGRTVRAIAGFAEPSAILAALAEVAE